MYMRWAIALGIGCFMHIIAEDDGPARTILVLREQQYYAACNDYRACEQEIQRIKDEQGGVYQADPWFNWHMYVHSVPWVVWQIAVIIVAILVSVLIPYVWNGKYRGLFAIAVCLLIITTYVAWSGYAQAQQVRGVVMSDHVPVYLGPGNDYPERGTVTYLDEVTILQRIEDWIKVRYTNTSGWIHADYIVDGSS